MSTYLRRLGLARLESEEHEKHSLLRADRAVIKRASWRFQLASAPRFVREVERPGFGARAWRALFGCRRPRDEQARLSEVADRVHARLLITRGERLAARLDRPRPAPTRLPGPGQRGSS
jgi:hypothetical protein